MEVLLLSACGLVAHHHYRMKNSTPSPQKLVTKEATPTENVVEEPVGVSRRLNPTVTTEIDTLGNMEPAHAPLGIRVLKTHNTTDPSYDEQRYNEQFQHADDPNARLEAPWTRLINAPYKAKQERLNSEPEPQEFLGITTNSKVKEMESEFARKTVPVTSEKQHDRPVEQISTGNGKAQGFHIGSGREHDRYVFNDQPTIESEGGPRGHSATGGKQHVAGLYETITQRSTFNHESVGPPVAVGVPQAGSIIPSMEITPAHSESWNLHKNNGKNSRAPVSSLTYAPQDAIRTAHDENIQVLENSLVTRGSHFGTGAETERETNIHVPLNRDPTVRFDERVAPNFKIGKQSDSKDQEIALRNPIVTDLSNNSLGANKNKKSPFVGSTVHKNTQISTQTAMLGASSRGLSLQAAKIEPDSIRFTEGRTGMDKRMSEKTSGMAPSSRVQSLTSNDSMFRTTNNLSEVTPTPFIRGSGGKFGQKLNGVQVEKDTSLSEMISSGTRSGRNNNSKPVNTRAVNEFNSKQDGIGANTNRDNMLAPVSKTLPGFLAKRPTGSVNASNMAVSLKREENLGELQLQKKPSSKTISKVDKTSTRSRKLGDLVNNRLGNSNAVKNLLKNPYSKPAAPRVF